MSEMLKSLLDENNEANHKNEITRKIIGCCYTVSNRLECGFLEKVYENALAYEVAKNGLHVLKQHSISVFYDQVVVGEYIADLLIESSVLVELKAVSALEDTL